MKLAILIQAHTNPKQVEKLSQMLSNENVDIFLNIDAKVDISPFKIKNTTLIYPRTKVYWGGFSQVRATLNALAQICSTEQNYHHILFISGQDFPLRPIENILTEMSEEGYIFGEELSAESTFHNRYKYKFLENRGKIFNKLAKIFYHKQREFYFSSQPIIKGSSWWCISSDCAKYILDFCDKNSDYLDFFKYSHCGDELFFHNIISRSPYSSSHLKPECEHFTFTVWEKNAKNPKILNDKDLSQARQTTKWFARKVIF